MRVLDSHEVLHVSGGSDADDELALIFFEIIYEVCFEIFVQFFIELTAAGIRKIHDYYYPPEMVVVTTFRTA
jgi:hypothetical protein